MPSEPKSSGQLVLLMHHPINYFALLHLVHRHHQHAQLLPDRAAETSPILSEPSVAPIRLQANMFGPRARALARPVIANARSYATRPSPAAAGPAAAGSSLGRTLLLGATAISMFGLIASQRDSARMEAERQSKKVIRSDKGSKPVYTQEEGESTSPIADPMRIRIAHAKGR